MFQKAAFTRKLADQPPQPHKDGEGDRVVIVTLAAPAQIDFYHIIDEFRLTRTRVYGSDELEGKAKLSVYLEPNSLLLLTGPSFLDYAHHIVPKDQDTISTDMINHHLLNSPLGTTIARGHRISMAVWSD